MISLIATITLAPSTWTMALGGDIMLNGVSASGRPLRGVESVFRNSDFAYANLEIPLTSATTRTTRKTAADLRARTQYILRADPAHIASLEACGFDIVSLGNNHAMDYGATGLRQMTKLLDRSDILWCGSGNNIREARKPAVFVTKHGLRLSMLSFLAFQNATSRWKCGPATESSPGIAEVPYDTALIRKLVSEAKSKSDVLAVALHWGLEKHTVPSPYQVKLGRAFVDAGADLVVGSHPHVLQGAEMYKNRPILYSLGNLVSSRPGATGIVKLTYQGKSLKGLDFVPCRISGGSVTAFSGTDSGFRSLCSAVAKRYPSKWSRIPKIR